MKAKSREEVYGNLPWEIKRKRGIEWCMRLLRENIDDMPEAEFATFVTEYEAIVAYPRDIGWYHSAYFNNDEREIRDEFKKYQTEAKKLMSIFQQNKEIRQKTTHKYTLRIFDGGYQFVDNDYEHGFEYSYVWRIGDFLRDRKFDDGFKKCKHCGNYFAVLSSHPKECCSHKCAVLLNKTKMFDGDEEKAKKFRKLESFYYRIKKMSESSMEKHSLLRNYLKRNNYKNELISPAIKKFLSKKIEN